MTPELIMSWSLAAASVAGAVWIVMVVVTMAIEFVAELVEDTREWLHRT